MHYLVKNLGGKESLIYRIISRIFRYLLTYSTVCYAFNEKELVDFNVAVAMSEIFLGVLYIILLFYSFWYFTPV